MKYEVTFFIARVIGDKGIPTTKQEDEQNLSINWLPYKEVGTLLEKQVQELTNEFYVPQFNCRTNLEVFKKFLEIQNKN